MKLWFDSIPSLCTYFALPLLLIFFISKSNWTSFWFWIIKVPHIHFFNYLRLSGFITNYCYFFLTSVSIPIQSILFSIYSIQYTLCTNFCLIATRRWFFFIIFLLILFIVFTILLILDMHSTIRIEFVFHVTLFIVMVDINPRHRKKNFCETNNYRANG